MPKMETAGRVEAQKAENGGHRPILWQRSSSERSDLSACHGLCGSNKQLYKRCAKSMGRQKFRPPQLPHFSTDLNETRNQERYPGYDPTRKIWLMWDDGKGVCVGRAFSVTFCVLFFFCILAHAYRSHQKTDHDRLWLKTRVSS